MSYKVLRGDTLSGIAKKFGTTYQELARINGISDPNKIQVGQVLRLPQSSSSSSSTTSTYKVASGDTLSKIAQRFGTTYQELARINGISDPNKIRVGQVLKLPNSSSNSNSTYSNTSISSYNTYTVVSGDNLSKIAQRFGTTYQEIARINGISDPNKIKVGQVLKIPASNYTSPQVPQPAPKPYIPSSQSSNKNSNTNQIVVHAKNTQVLDALKNSQWSSKAEALSVAYFVIKDCGYSTECAIGLMANLLAEGNYGLVEYAFSKSHSFGFRLPSGGFVCKTIADIEYMRDWTTSNEGTGNSKWKKGSCGFGSVQWSYGRRVNFAKLCLSIMKTDSDVNDKNWSIAEATFITQELKNEYYSRIAKAANAAGGSVEAWAEAFCDKYEMPQHADLKMNATGSACITRRKYAKDIYEYLKKMKALD